MLDHVVTLVGTQAAPLDPAAADAVRAALRRLGAGTGPVDWLSPEEACDIPFEDLDPDQADAAARAALGTIAVDVVAQPQAHRRKRLLMADMESTLIRNEMLDELGALAGHGEAIAAITARAMNGELDFAGALRERVALLKGMSVRKLEEAAARIALMPGAAALVATMKAHGALTVTVSGGFRFFTRRVRAALGLDLDVANDLVIEHGRLAGTVVEPILGRPAKSAALVHIAADRGIALADCLAVGDGANDTDMILAAGLGIAFRAKPALAARARWRIDHADLTALLYAQGYRREEFA
ncbi:MAG TPA: phosphoserine phosphatase SerB [Stellaceae bacterium]|nr:phosphoserine phosphatase SerB [Stellaceae bacterium]